MPKRKYSVEFKESAVKLVHERGYTVVEAAKSLGVVVGTDAAGAVRSTNHRQRPDP
jgi:transposase-like protein